MATENEKTTANENIENEEVVMNQVVVDISSLQNMANGLQNFLKVFNSHAENYKAGCDQIDAIKQSVDEKLGGLGRNVEDFNQAKDELLTKLTTVADKLDQTIREMVNQNNTLAGALSILTNAYQTATEVNGTALPALHQAANEMKTAVEARPAAASPREVPNGTSAPVQNVQIDKVVTAISQDVAGLKDALTELKQMFGELTSEVKSLRQKKYLVAVEPFVDEAQRASEEAR